MSHGDASKRAYDGAGSSVPPDKKLRPEGDGAQEGESSRGSSVVLTLRLMVDDKSVGGLIGKKGVVVNKLRGDTGCQVDVSKPVQGASKRVVTVSGRMDSLGVLLSMISSRLLEQRTSGGNAGSEISADTSAFGADHSITLLVDNAVVGTLIGKGGATVAETRKTSGASVRISEKALGNSTEKSVCIRGTSQAVDTAVNIILAQLAEKADKLVQVPYRPGPDGGQGFVQDPYGGAYNIGSTQHQSDPYGGNVAGLGQAYGSSLYGQGGAYGVGLATQQYGGGGGYGSAAGGGGGGIIGGGGGRGGVGFGETAESSLVVPVPESCIGSVIGKGGRTIEDIRLRSGASINVPKNEGGDRSSGADRQVAVSGTATAVKIAQALIFQRMQEALQKAESR
eukprot:gb/GEZN01007501.1/.p1 GENE.gb/GEZN01007501.1/~~gb/GEZN01007501.1/.p1  ORF type:complete len:395 (+),score=65.39 gb/GEZN01007501.1/:83-1267(+)